MAATFESFKHRWPLPLALAPGGGSVVPVSGRFTWSLRLLCCAALGVTGYLAVTAMLAGEVAGCGGGAVWDCDLALHSRWSKVLTLPVSYPAFGLYAVMLTALSVCTPSAPRSRLRLAWGVVTAGALLSGLAAFWFIGLQIFAVGHLCIYCIAAHLCGLALCLAVLWKRPLGARTTRRLAGLGMMGVALLIAAQVFAAPPQTFKVEHYPSDVATNDSTAPPASDSGSKHQEKKRTVEVFEPPAGVPDDAAEK
jgi:uncharacterized membrane protein